MVGVRDGARGQVPTDARKVDLAASVVSLNDKLAGDCVEQTGFRGTRPLIEVAGILVQERWQQGITDEDIGVAPSVSGAQPLQEALPILTVARVAVLLIDSSV